MAALPSQDELTKRSQEAQDKILQFKAAYENLVKEWELIQSTEQHILKELHEHVDSEKIKFIAQTISNIKP